MSTAHRIYLASRSPRRWELLSRLGLEAIVVLPPSRAAGKTEPRLGSESPAEYARRTTLEKALAAFDELERQGLPPLPLVAADTTVAVGERILPKPSSRAEEISFLHLLSGKSHDVLTAVAVGTGRDTTELALSVSRVRFRPLTEAEIEAYASTDEPYDKAGGYAIQGIASIFIERLEGSYSGVMGLPLFETAGLLSRFGVSVLPGPSEHRGLD